MLTPMVVGLPSGSLAPILCGEVMSLRMVGLYLAHQQGLDLKFAMGLARMVGEVLLVSVHFSGPLLFL